MTIKDKFPKSFELYRDYIKSQIRTLDTVGMPDEFITTLVTDNIVEIAIKKSTRDLYDFFDFKNITVSVWNDGTSWKYRVDDKMFPTTANIGGDRLITEQKAFDDAFSRLERR
jgi:hypothetical protein